MRTHFKAFHFNRLKFSIFTQDWTVLDVHFGIPLFDVDTNTQICQYIKNLANDEK
jgi:hypothetical protein